ncbi:MAG: bifunctional GNAT family N-acetyltransferase/PLP-dependent aspartate aminotransferase family protein [Akkermansiaceae bacterium]
MFPIKFRSNQSVYLRNADITDAKMLHEWRNDPWIVEKGRSKKTVPWDEHLSWLSNALKDDDRLIYIILIDHQPSGAAFFTRDGTDCSISIYLLKPYTGRGLGSPIIRQASTHVLEHWQDLIHITAEILTTNAHSSRGFVKAGYQLQSTQNDYATYTLTRPQSKPVIPHNRPHSSQAEASAALQSSATGMWVNGHWTLALESRLTQLSSESHKATTLSSGFTALKFALQVLGVGRGDEVIIPAYSCVALTNAALSLGAIPVPCDICPNTLNITAKSVQPNITDRTKAIIVVHTFGRRADIEELKTLSNIPVIEDGSHGFPIDPHTNKWKIGSDVAITSFYATKLIGCGMAGAIFCRSESLTEKARDMRSYVDKMPSAQRENASISEMEAAIAYRQLDQLDGFIKKRAGIAERYHESLSSLNSHHFSPPSRGSGEIWYRYNLQCDSLSTLDGLKNFLTNHDTASIHAEKPVEPWLDSIDLDNYPVAKNSFNTQLSLPVYPSLTLEQVDIVTNAIQDFTSNHNSSS